MTGPVRVIDVDELGQPALVVNAPSARYLLLDTGLSDEDRVDILLRFFPLGGDQ